MDPGLAGGWCIRPSRTYKIMESLCLEPKSNLSGIKIIKKPKDKMKFIDLSVTINDRIKETTDFDYIPKIVRKVPKNGR